MDGSALGFSDVTSSAIYPGSTTTTDEFLRLARDFHRAANSLLIPGDGTILTPPGRLNSIHAIELYLNAFLSREGLSNSEIRGLQHDMSLRTDLALERGLVLRQKTIEHLRWLGANREYLRARYEVEHKALRLSELNRLTATLEQVSKAVMQALK